MAKKSYVNAVLEAVTQEMRANPDMVYYYEEPRTAVQPSGAMLDPGKEFGDIRTSGRGWPIDETWIVGVTIGVAAAGSKAVARLPSMTNFYAFEYIFNQAGKLRAMTGGQASMPLVVWLDGAGRSKGMAAQHTDAGMESVYAQLPGLKVVVPSNAYDAKGLMITAIRDPDPVIFCDYSEVRSGAQPDVPDEPYEIPLGKAVVRQEGRHLTIVAWAPATVQVEKALPMLAKAGVSAEFIDLRSLKPMDIQTVAASVRKTGKLLVVEHGHYTNGFGAHVVAEAVQAVRGIKVGRIAFPDVPCPGAPNMVNYLRPDAPNIADAATQLVKG
jgi:pyruvate/2-oxoglutarate/acetoin dehydrogenase E1 component